MSDNPTSGQILTHRSESSPAPQIAGCRIPCSPLIRAFTQPLTSGSLRARSTTLSSDVDMNSSINASAMFPQLRLTPARAAFARPGPHATAFPDVNAPTQPSDSLVPFGRRSGRPSPAAYPGAQVLFFTAAPVPPLTGATPETFLPRLPISRLSPEEKRGYPRCLGHPLRACRAQRPRRVRPPLARSRCGRCCLQAV